MLAAATQSHAQPKLPEAVFLGTTSFVIRDGTHSLIIDGFCSRPGKLFLRRIAPDPSEIAHCLRMAGVTQSDGLFVAHSHYDHALDSAYVAGTTGATLYGSRSTQALGRGERLEDHRNVLIKDGDVHAIGQFGVRVFETPHNRPELYKGAIKEPWAPNQRISKYRSDKNYSFLVTHRDHPSLSALIIPSASADATHFEGIRAEIVFLSVGMLVWQSDADIEAYWDNTVRKVRAERVVPIHWDNFRVSLRKPLERMPFPPDLTQKSLSKIAALAARDGVAFELPAAFQSFALQP